MRRYTRRLILPTLILLAGCSAEITGPNPTTTAITIFRGDGMAFTATVRVSPDDDRVMEMTLRVENESGQAGSTSILGGNCMLRGRLYHPAKGTDEWSQFEKGEACQEPLQVFELGPGESATVSRSTRVGVGSGTYFATVTFDFLSGFPTSYVELVAGNIAFP